MPLKGQSLTWLIALFLLSVAGAVQAGERTPIKAIYIPVADHYAGIVAYEKYRNEMQYADYQVERMKSWPLLRAYFETGEVDLAFVMGPLAMDMFLEQENFRWVGLMHRDGNALAINDKLNVDVRLHLDRSRRKPDPAVAKALVKAKEETGRPVLVGVPHLKATHTVVLYKYLKEQNLRLGLDSSAATDVMAIQVAPLKSPSFLRKNNGRGIGAAFEQSLPWADVVETQGYGHVAWYSKDVLIWPPYGHVECIIVATDAAIASKRKPVHEVIDYIHRAGQDLEKARSKSGPAMEAISKMIRHHIPEHNEEAIAQSLRTDLNVINYRHLNVDKAGLRQIMDLAVEGGIIKEPINIDDFADDTFASRIKQQ